MCHERSKIFEREIVDEIFLSNLSERTEIEEKNRRAVHMISKEINREIRRKEIKIDYLLICKRKFMFSF